MTIAQQPDSLESCLTRVQLSVHQIAHQRKRICRALDHQWQRRQQSTVVLDAQPKETVTQVQLSSPQVEQGVVKDLAHTKKELSKKNPYSRI